MRQIVHSIRENWLQYLLFMVMLGISTAYLLKPFYDNDFFWHLKSGEWIWENGRLPDRDQFSYTTPSLVSASARFYLTSYWLSQVVLYLAYLGNGLSGIVALRFVCTAVLFAAMMKRLSGDRVINASLMVFFSILLLNFYFMERPQTASFVYFGILLLVLERLKNGEMPDDKGRWSFFAFRYALFLSLVMVLWSNSHGGHLIGQVTLVIYMAVEGAKFLHQKLNPLASERYVRLVLAGGCGLIGSLVNPNNCQALLLMLKSKAGAGEVGTHIQEYSSMLEFYRMSHTPVIVLYLTVVVVTVIVLLSSPRELDLTELVLLMLVGYFAFKHVRYAAFLPIAVLPLLARRLADVRVVRWGRKILPPVALCTAVYAVSGEFYLNLATAKEGNWISTRRFPVAAANFVIANNLQGNMYNQYDWGGYLIWRLGPKRMVFADGRNLNEEIIVRGYQIDTAQMKYATGERVWKTWLDHYEVNYTLTYSRTPSGEVTPLVTALLRDREWVPVFSDRGSRSVIFVRNTPANARVIANSRFTGI